MEEIQEEVGFTLAEVLKLKPELLKLPEFDPTRYGRAGEDLFEKISKYGKDLGLFAERANLIKQTNVDFVIKDKSDTIKFIMDIEQDNSGGFLDDGTFKWWELHIPLEKEKYFYQNYPFFYVKFNENFQYCYVLDGWACRNLLIQKNKLCKIHQKTDEKINRIFLSINSNKAFNSSNPLAIHRCKIQDFMKAIIFFQNMRYAQLKINDFFQIK